MLFVFLSESHLTRVSPHTCLTSRVSHLMCVSPHTCLTSCVSHLTRVSPHTCLTSCVSHHMSPPLVCPSGALRPGGRIVVPVPPHADPPAGWGVRGVPGSAVRGGRGRRAPPPAQRWREVRPRSAQVEPREAHDRQEEQRKL